MIIVYVVETYTDGLGYIDNILPREFARSGMEVHVVTCRLPPYYQFNEDFFGDVGKAGGTASEEVTMEGLKIHTMAYGWVGKRVFMRRLHQLLRKIAPDVVVIRGIASPIYGQVIFSKLFLKFRIFSSAGLAYTAFPESIRCSPSFSIPRLQNFLVRYLPGQIYSYFTRRCVASSDDGAKALVEFYGIPAQKISVISLGVDTELFSPVDDEVSLMERRSVRAEIGFSEEDVVCIWTGRMTGQKGLAILAQAVEELRADGWNFRALFVGDGPESAQLDGFGGSLHIPFVRWDALPPLYRAADMAVWPRSITTSTLDASACGLPVIMSDREAAVERWEGMGCAYVEGSVASLKLKLLEFVNLDVRTFVGRNAVETMRSKFSWKSICAQFLALFERA
jgi:glycosyltransferase involved in cell wall biosynthesis